MPPAAPSARHPPPPLPENQNKRHKCANQILYACESELGCEFEFAPANMNLELKIESESQFKFDVGSQCGFGSASEFEHANETKFGSEL